MATKKPRTITYTPHQSGPHATSLISSLGPGFLFIMGKEKSALWAYFVVTGRNHHGEPNRVRCTYRDCTWEQGANATRMKKHLAEAHVPKAEAMNDALVAPAAQVAPSPMIHPPSTSEALPAPTLPTPTTLPTSAGGVVQQSTQSAASTTSEGAAAKPTAGQVRYAAKKQRTAELSQYFDRPFSEDEQEAAHLAQAYMVVMNGLSYNSQEDSATISFYKRLRPAYKPLTRYLLEKKLEKLEADTRKDVTDRLMQAKVVTLAIDGWEDHQKLPTLAFSARTLLGQPYLVKFERIKDRETGEVLEGAIKDMKAELNELGIKVVGVIADNAANIQKGIRLSKDVGVLQLNCLAHTLNLLLEDLGALFKPQFDQAVQMETFFRVRHAANIQYQDSKKGLKGTNLLQAVETRWGCHIDLLGSIIRNRAVVEDAFLALRRDKFPFKGNELMFWVQGEWWDSIKSIHDTFLPLRKAITLVESDTTTLAMAIHSIIPVLGALPQAIKAFAPGDVKKATRLIDERKPMLFHDTALCAYMFDHRFRGVLLTPTERSTALRAMPDIANILGLAAPSMDAMSKFLGRDGCYGTLAVCHPVNFWVTLFGGDCLSPLGAILCGLPASQACVERTFSASDWAVDNRERLGFTKLAREVYIKVNTQALSRK